MPSLVLLKLIYLMVVWNGLRRNAKEMGGKLPQLTSEKPWEMSWHLIRFPLMPLEIFSNFVTTTGLLNKDESLSVFLYLTRKRVNRNDSEHPRFPVKKRAAAPQQKNIISNGWFGPPSQFFTECILCSYLYETDKERCPNCGAINEWTTLIFSSESILVDINLNIESTL